MFRSVFKIAYFSLKFCLYFSGSCSLSIRSFLDKEFKMPTTNNGLGTD